MFVAAACSHCVLPPLRNPVSSKFFTESDVNNLLVDGGYSGENFANKIKNILGANVTVAKRSELHTFAVIQKRWVVERSFEWIEKSRRLWKNCERKINMSLQMIVLRFVELLLKRF